MAKIIDGKKIALEIRKGIKEKITRLPSQPGLAVILVGEDPGSVIYVELKQRAAREAGIYFEKHAMADSTLDIEVVSLIKKLNTRLEINGILVQLPLPSGADETKVISAIRPDKDVDGFHPENLEWILFGRPRILPGLSTGILKLIVSTGEALSGKKAMILANSRVFAEPLKFLLEQKGAKVEVCYPDQPNCQQLTREADILVVAIGRPRFITAEMVKPGAIVIDVGYNRDNGKVVGDVDFNSVKNKVGWISPVPGGVGPMTVSMLLNNVVLAYENQQKTAV